MNFFAVNIILICYILYVITINKRYMHMLQLNSYMNLRFWKWFKTNITKEISVYSFLQLGVLLPLLWDNYFLSAILWVCSFLILFIFRKQTKEKKKFVVTARVRRMYITFGVIFAIIIALGNIILAMDGTLSTVIFLAILVVVSNLKITYVLAANAINFPIERSISRWYYNDAKRMLNENKRLTIIGITGSYGKTSCKYILSRILGEKYNVLMTPESYNTLMGVVRTVREQLKPTHEVFVVEMGAKQKGDIKEICDLVKPKYGLLTAVGPQHLETFKSIENVAKTKYELVDSLPNDGAAFLNFENEIIRQRKSKGKHFSYGIENNNLSYWAEDIRYGNRGSTFKVCSKNKTPFEVSTKLMGRHNVLNIIGACGISIELGVEPENIQFAVKQLAAVPHRLELKPSVAGGVTIIDDAFNSNPEGANEAVNVLGKFKCPMRILITPGMIELGDREYQCNLDFGKNAAANCDFVILVGIKRSVPIHEGLKQAGYAEDKIFVAKNLTEALEKMKQIAVPDSVVLFENDLPDNYEE